MLMLQESVTGLYVHGLNINLFYIIYKLSCPGCITYNIPSAGVGVVVVQIRP